MRRVGAVRCAAAAVLFGASTPAASVLAADLPALVLAGLLYVGAASAVLPTVVHRPPSRAALQAASRPLALAVVLGGALGPALLVVALQQIPAATASLLLNLELVATLVIAATVLHEHVSRRLLVAGTLLTVAGLLLVWQPGAAFDLGGLLVVAACLCWGVDNSVTAHVDQLRPEHITFAKGAVAGTANLALDLALTGVGGVRPAPLAGALLVGALGYGLSITLWVKGARELGAARGQVIFAFAPFVGAVISWTALGESPTAAQVVALPLAAAGVALSLHTAHTHVHRHEAVEHEHEHAHDDGHHDHEHGPGLSARRHTHRHRHEPVEHAHPHLPDLHHLHGH